MDGRPFSCADQGRKGISRADQGYPGPLPCQSGTAIAAGSLGGWLPS